MENMIVKNDSTEAFFLRGLTIARHADQGKILAREKVVSFEDPDDRVKLLASAHQAIFCELKPYPESMTELG